MKSNFDKDKMIIFNANEGHMARLDDYLKRAHALQRQAGFQQASRPRAALGRVIDRLAVGCALGARAQLRRKGFTRPGAHRQRHRARLRAAPAIRSCAGCVAAPAMSSTVRRMAQARGSRFAPTPTGFISAPNIAARG